MVCFFFQVSSLSPNQNKDTGGTSRDVYKPEPIEKNDQRTMNEMLSLWPENQSNSRMKEQSEDSWKKWKVGGS